MNYGQILSDCWSFGSSYLPAFGCGLPLSLAALLPGFGAGEVINLRDRRFRVLQKLGEGGYAVVYLVAELSSIAHPHPDPELRALKKVLVQSNEHLEAVAREIRIHAAVQHHPHVLPLLDCCCPGDGSAANGDDSSADVGSGTGGGGGSGGSGLTAAVAGAQDIRISLPGAAFDRGASSGGVRGGDGGGGEGGDGVACFLFPVYRDGTLAAELAALRDRGELLPTREVLALFIQLLKAARHIHSLGFAHRYRCVLMDFGSARSRTVELPSRPAALALQEDAEAHCSAPYRAPELFDAPSPGALDLAAADVWALGASLFEIMYGEPPFARAMNAGGGSLALAVLNCAIGWPRPPAPAYPQQLHDLVTAAMAAEPAARPSAEQLAATVDALMQQPLPDAASQS
ncbi:hypothetical protein GPECTOR_51g739 [Gonium pectorale]|uniref:non-specific serine/threonine protein kinase n=1 Tax=Gonium pectorale TaxID=33097 RepID=A0A150G7K7_GONPE|nr:hypothetical protein GPECTOR_51g739 [Gonium pectorale]|eukprot:KXZ45753.1 hypothetical protein GPECTOR_51g739 [Gonium pectorale]